MDKNYSGIVTIILPDTKPRFIYRSRQERRVILEYWRRECPNGFEIQICPDTKNDPEDIVGLSLKKSVPVDQIAFIRPKAEYTNIDSNGYGIAKELHSQK